MKNPKIHCDFTKFYSSTIIFLDTKDLFTLLFLLVSWNRSQNFSNFMFRGCSSLAQGPQAAACLTAGARGLCLRLLIPRVPWFPLSPPRMPTAAHWPEAAPGGGRLVARGIIEVAVLLPRLDRLAGIQVSSLCRVLLDRDYMDPLSMKSLSVSGHYDGEQDLYSYLLGHIASGRVLKGRVS